MLILMSNLLSAFLTPNLPLLVQYMHMLGMENSSQFMGSFGSLTIDTTFQMPLGFLFFRPDCFRARVVSLGV